MPFSEKAVRKTIDISGGANPDPGISRVSSQEGYGISDSWRVTRKITIFLLYLRYSNDHPLTSSLTP